MTVLVKLLSDEDEQEIEKERQVWCIISNLKDSGRTLCQGQCFGYGEGHCSYIFKEVKRGGITCKECLLAVKYFKSIKL